MKKAFIFTLAYLFTSPVLCAQESILRYDIFEKIIERNLPDDAMMKEVSMKARFYDNYNRVHFVNGFHDGGGTWKVRFAPDNPQDWKYSIEFSDADTVYTGSFNCRWNIGPVEPFQVNPLNSRWFKRIVHPFLVKGTQIEWDVLLRYDTLRLKSLKDYGFNTVLLDCPVNARINLLSENFESIWILEKSLKWIYDNNMIAVMPVFLFPPDDKPLNRVDWNNYIRDLFARFGAYQTFSFYIPGNFGSKKIPPEEMKIILRAIAEYNKYSSPVGIADYSFAVAGNESSWYELLTGSPTEFSKGPEPVRPQVVVIPDEVNSNPAKLVHYLSESFIKGVNCVTDQSLIHDGIIEKGLPELWSFFESIPYYDMKTDNIITRDAACIGIDRKEYLLLSTNLKKLKLNLGTDFYRAFWINPFNADKKIDAGIVTGVNTIKVPGGGNLWFLQLNKRLSGYPMGVHLSWSDKPEGSFTVTWNSISSNNPCKVLYRKKGESEWTERTGSSQKSSGTAWIHSVVVTNLESAATYQYKVSADSILPGVFSNIFEVSTAPEGNDASFSFLFITDTGLEGRLDNNATGTRRIINEVLGENPDFILGGGDYAYANRDKRYKSTPDAILAWFDLYQPVIANIPFMTQYGNHELYLQEQYSDWSPYFKHPKGFPDGRHYSFEIGNFHFTSFCLVDKPPTEEDLNWLDQDLSDARARNKWLIVYHHEPIYAYGTSHPSKPEITGLIYPLMRKYEVDLNINAHDQNYERTFPLTGPDPLNPLFNHTGGNVYRKGEGTIFMKVSPSGKKSEIGNMFPLLKEAPPFISNQDRSSHHLAVFRVISGKSLEVKIYGVPDDGSPKYVIDNFVIGK
jgi:hypothetical protein